MKLWKMNALLIILSLSLCSCTELSSKSHSRRVGSFEDAYSENEKYLSDLEEGEKSSKSELLKMEEVAAEDTENSFIEKPSPKKQLTAKKSTKYNKSKSGALLKAKPKQAHIEKAHTIEMRKIPNPRIKTYDAKFVKFEKCNKKTGYLYLVKDMKRLPIEIAVTPIFASLSLSSFNLFLGVGDDKTLFNTVKLKDIVWISQQRMLTGHHCFEVVHGDVIRDQGELHKQSTTLCATSNNEMQKWIDAVGAFKECQVNVHNIDHNRVVLADFQKVNELLKESNKGFGIGSGSHGPNAYASLYYDNNPTIHTKPKHVEKLYSIKNEISKIVESIKVGNIQQNKIARKMKNQLKEAKKFSQEVHEKQRIIKKILEQRAEKEKARRESMMKNEEKHKELELLKAVQNRLMQMKKQEMKKFSKSYENQIMEERRKAENESKEMMRALIQEEKLTDYGDCTDSRLMFFEDKSYVQKLCFRYYGEHKGERCEMKENFCNMCCDHHVGRRYLNKVADCKSKCSGLLKGINWKFTTKMETTNTNKTAKGAPKTSKNKKLTKSSSKSSKKGRKLNKKKKSSKTKTKRQ